MEYDVQFGALIRKKSTYPLDGVPLIAGIECLLKQFHPAATTQLLAYLGQFIRSTVQFVLQDVESSSKHIEIPKEVINTLIFMDLLAQFSSIPRAVLYAYVPAYIFDCLKLSSK